MPADRLHLVPVHRTENWPVYGGPGFVPMPEPWGRQARLIICAPSGAAARRAFAAVGWTITMGDWRHGWCDTGNAVELAVAHASPGVPLYQPEHGAAHQWPRGVWLPLTWPIPAPKIPSRADGYAPTPCTSCGTSIEDCDEKLFGHDGKGCCSRCRTTDTHNDPIDHPLHTERIRAAARRVRRG